MFFQTRFVQASALLIAAASLIACGDDTETNNPGPTGGTGGGNGGMGNTSTGGMGGEGGNGNGPGTIYEVASSLEDYSVLVAAVDKAGLAPALQDPAATLTVFAPDNDAFMALLGAIGASSLDDLSAEQLRPILLYHVLDGAVDSTAAAAAADAGDKVDALGGSIQLGLDGSNIQLDEGAIVETADVEASNGIIHGIDAVILPSITDVVVTDTNFSSLATALTVADTDPTNPGFVGALDDNTGSFTVFAPTDTAFTGLVDALSASASTGITGLGDFQPYQLIPVLKYHYVDGAAVTSSMVMSGDIPTEGGIVVADTTNGVMIDGAMVTTADILTANGVIHVIDSVLVPSITDVVTTAPEFDGLADEVIAADGDPNTSPKIAPLLDAPAASGAYTLFAPDNAAFNIATPSGQTLTNILAYHALNEATPIYAADALALAGPTGFNTLQGDQITASVDGTDVIISDNGSAANATVTGANYFTSNGVIHRIDKVLLP